MAFSLKGIHVPHRKNTADMSAIRMPAPKAVTLLNSIMIGLCIFMAIVCGVLIKTFML